MTARYELTFNTGSQKDQTDLTSASLRVIEGWLGAFKSSLQGSSIEKKGDKPVLVLKLATPDDAAALTERLTAPFTMQIMREAGEKETADITIEKIGGFKATGITEKDVQWVDSQTNPQTGKGAASIIFTAEGGQKLKKLFAENNGKSIGIFVRGRLVSRKLVDGTDTQESILIDNIPSPEVAKVFADDVNVGLHVTFTLVK